MRAFERTFAISETTRVLDVGGSPLIWEFAKARPKLTFLNFPSALERSGANEQLVAGDGRLLPFKDQAFDIVFSNSVIEHVGNRADQQRFAGEVARVGRSYWVQTPARSFPFELHLMLPIVHHLPKRWQRAIVERFTLWQLVVRPSEAERDAFIHHFLYELNLMGRKDVSAVFPDARIVAERSMGFTKSIIAIRK
jgi:hypothetical protein